jgi:hypothetical protein
MALIALVSYETVASLLPTAIVWRLPRLENPGDGIHYGHGLIIISELETLLHLSRLVLPSGMADVSTCSSG